MCYQSPSMVTLHRLSFPSVEKQQNAGSRGCFRHVQWCSKPNQLQAMNTVSSVTRIAEHGQPLIRTSPSVLKFTAGPSFLFICFNTSLLIILNKEISVCSSKNNKSLTASVPEFSVWWPANHRQKHKGNNFPFLLGNRWLCSISVTLSKWNCVIDFQRETIFRSLGELWKGEKPKPTNLISQ